MTNETKLTPTEAGAHRLAMQEHKAKKCHRCCGRLDLKAGGFRCAWGEDAQERMRDLKHCGKFMLQDDQGEWLK